MKTIRKEATIDVSQPDAAGLRTFLAEQNISLKSNELERIRELFGRLIAPKLFTHPLMHALGKSFGKPVGQCL